MGPFSSTLQLYSHENCAQVCVQVCLEGMNLSIDLLLRNIHYNYDSLISM